MLTHTSGLAYGLGIDNHPVEKVYQEAGFLSDVVALRIPLEEVVAKLAELPSATQPGAEWRYSIAYDVIGHLIEFITDKPLDLLLKERIFDPLGMIDTGFFVPEDNRDRFGPMCSFPEEAKISAVDKGENSPFQDPDIAPSGGASWSPR